MIGYSVLKECHLYILINPFSHFYSFRGKEEKSQPTFKLIICILYFMSIVSLLYDVL